MRERQLLRDCLEIIQQTYKGKPAGVPVERITPGLYVVDWRAESDDINTVLVERIADIDDDLHLIFFSTGSTTDMATFASIVLAGPFGD